MKIDDGYIDLFPNDIRECRVGTVEVYLGEKKQVSIDLSTGEFKNEDR